MPRNQNRFRLTIAGFMAIIAVFALSCASSCRSFGRPPRPAYPWPARRWLFSKPASASCKDCHGNVTIASRAKSLVPLPGAPKSCAFAGAQATSSCMSCHRPALTSAAVLTTDPLRLEID